MTDVTPEQVLATTGHDPNTHDVTEIPAAAIISTDVGPIRPRGQSRWFFVTPKREPNT